MIGHRRRIVQNRFSLSLPMTADDKKFVSLPFTSEESDRAALMMINGKGTWKKKMAINAAAASVHITSFFKCSAADAYYRGSNDREHGRF